jgi:hypothetical protein
MRTAIIFMIVLFAVDCFGSASVSDFTVRNWQKIGLKELEINVVDAQNTEKVIHIRFNPDRVTALIQDEDKRANAERQYDEALAQLKQQLRQSKTITVWLYSSIGFRPIKGRPGHYRTDWMYIPSWENDGKRVCLVTSDLGSKSPN